ncbi:MAG: hypothetical protein C0478_04385 [Planctomyces sp.]|jgi:predicted ATPase|nr:hypothetical protein [Planctomyces sp.]
MFDSISFENYRSIRKLHVDLKPINVLFGPNGSGKSTILAAVDLLSRTLRSGLRDSLRHTGGIDSLRTFGIPREEVTRVAVSQGVFEYARSFEWMHHRDGATGHESLYAKGAQPSVVVFDSMTGELWGRHLSYFSDPHAQNRFAAPSMWDLAIESELWTGLGGEDDLGCVIRFRELLASVYVANCRRLDIDRLAEVGSRSQDGDELGFHGEGLWNVLRNLRDSHSTSAVYRKIVEFLRVAFPGFVDYELRTVGQSVSCSVVSDSHLESYPVALAHDGLVHLTYCLCLLFCRGDLDSTVILDEPDLSLHPWALTVLADAIKEAASKWNRQVILATHSPTLLSEFKEEEILLMQSGENGVTATRVSDIQEDRDLLDRYDLGSLYQMNIIGKQGDKPLYTEVDATE